MLHHKIYRDHKSYKPLEGQKRPALINTEYGAGEREFVAFPYLLVVIVSLFIVFVNSVHNSLNLCFVLQNEVNTKLNLWKETFLFLVNPKKALQLKVRRKLDIPISWKSRIVGVIKVIKAQKTRMETLPYSLKRELGLRIFSPDISFQDCFSQLCQPVLHCRC